MGDAEELIEPRMKCPRCQHENPGDAVFCQECGSRLEEVCPGCGTANRVDAKFCKKCGQHVAVMPPAATAAPVSAPAQSPAPASYTPPHLAERIRAEQAALEARGVTNGERKTITALFADLAGFTALARDLDPEVTRAIVDPALHLMMEAVHRYEGYVAQSLGDGIFALFGAPIAHENHPQRAVYAALRMQEDIKQYADTIRLERGVPLQMRVGINTGEVVVRSIRTDDLHTDYVPVGHSTNLASRMESLATPGTIVVSEQTHKLTEGYFAYKALGAVQVKGLEEPVSIYEVEGIGPLRTKLQVAARRGLARFVGRQREMESLQNALAQAKAGHGQIVGVMGEPGVGKSRLFYEFKLLSQVGCLVLETFSVSHGKAYPYLPLVDLLKNYFQLTAQDDERKRRERITGKVLTLDRSLEDTLPYLFHLLGIAEPESPLQQMDPQIRRKRTLEAIKRLLVRESLNQPLILICEDLHWLDNETQAFLSLLSESLANAKVLLLVNYRPEYRHEWGNKTYYTRLRLDPLGREHAEEMLAALLAEKVGATGQSPLHQFILEKTEGNPFFMEEIVQALVEEGLLTRDVVGAYDRASLPTDIQLPPTVQAVLASRIDRLPPEEKDLLQTLAVIGREFSLSLLKHVVDHSEDTLQPLLSHLRDAEFIYEQPAFPESEYVFKHALTQDVAYASLLVQRRKELHGLIGLAIEELYVDRLAEHYEVLAHHFSLAEDWERALHYLVKAADKAVAAFGLREALDLYAQSLEAARRQADRVPASIVMNIHRLRADLFFGIGEFDRSRAEAEVLVELARRVRDRTAEAGALAQIANAQQWAENFPAALERAREAIEIAEPLEAQSPLAGALYVRGYVHGVSGRLDEAEADYERALTIGRAVGDAARQALSLHLLALHRSWQGRYREGLELGEEGMRIAREHRLVIPLLRCLWNEGLGRHETGEYDAALAAFEEGLVLAEKIGDEAYLSRFLNTLGWLRIDCGDFARGVELSERSYEVTSRSNRAGHSTGAERRAFIRNNEADALMAQGDLAGAGEALEESLRTVQHPPPSRWMTWRYTTHCYASLGQLALLRGDAVQARRMADQSLEVAAPTSSRKYESWAWRVKGESATALHAWDEAEDALRRAHAIAEAIRQPRSTWLSRVALGRLAAARGRRDDALGHYRVARALIAALRAGVQDPGLRRGLETSPLILEVEDLARPE